MGAHKVELPIGGLELGTGGQKGATIGFLAHQGQGALRPVGKHCNGESMEMPLTNGKCQYSMEVSSQSNQVNEAPPCRHGLIGSVES